MDINQSDRGLFSMLIDQLVAIPGEWGELRGYRFDSEPDGGVLTTGMERIVDEFSQVLWSALEYKDRLASMKRILLSLESGDYPAQIAGESLEWGINNRGRG